MREAASIVNVIVGLLSVAFIVGSLEKGDFKVAFAAMSVLCYAVINLAGHLAD